MTDRHRTELVRRPKDSGKCTWTDHVGRFSAKHLHFKVKMPKRKVAARQMLPLQTEGQPDDGQHDQEKEEPSQPHINPEQAEAIAQSKKRSNASEW
ncbi:hypothetical protein DPMN_181155 [Dreissena polymorpha]|uniref:Uncharacterized protein n=1 Tax=Dreissena polymorpha TaxID=45954 RepID=A0A9D4I3F9_DREPO|nr:hypothetical protein DPMN_181155 [Dreissena polymorpha]